MRFEWLLVDDGSVDTTEETVSRWISEAPFQLRYVRQENAGKHVAHNRGAQDAAGRLFICVDSDDWLEPLAVETIISDAEALGPEESLIYPKMFSSQADSGKWFPAEVDKIELADMRMKYRLVLETAIVFNTKVLRRHPFPVVEGERYMPEGAAYYDFRNPELFLVRNAAFYRCEYLDEGLTRNIWKNWLDNPIGTRTALVKRFGAANRYSGLHALREKLSVIAAIESLNMACGSDLCEGIESLAILPVICLPIAAWLRKKRFGGKP